MKSNLRYAAVSKFKTLKDATVVLNLTHVDLDSQINAVFLERLRTMTMLLDNVGTIYQRDGNPLGIGTRGLMVCMDTTVVPLREGDEVPHPLTVDSLGRICLANFTYSDQTIFHLHALPNSKELTDVAIREAIERYNDTIIQNAMTTNYNKINQFIMGYARIVD